MKSNYTSLTLKFILILCICNMSPLNSQTLLKNNDPLSSEALLSNNLSSNTQMLPACAQALGAGQLLCYNRNTDGTMTVFLAQGTVIRQKILDKNGATLSTTTMGSIAQDSVLVKNNQVIKKLANGTIAFTKNIPPSVLSLFPTINAAVEMSDGTFVLGGFQKIIASNNGVPFSRDSLVLVSTDVNLNLQNVTIEVPRSELGFVSTVALDSLLQLMPMPNNRFLAIYNFGISAIVTSNNLVFSIFQKTGTSLSKEKTNTFAGHTFKNQPSRTTLCGNNLMFEARIKNVGQKGSYSGTSAYIFNLDSVFVVTEKRVGSGNTSNFGNYNSYFYNHRPTLRDTAFQISANYAGDPRIGLNDFLSLEVKFYNNSATATHSKIMPFVQYDHIMRTGDTTLLVLGSENGEIWVFNPDCNATQAALPDLTLANLNDVTPSVAQGQILKFKVDIKNIGADSTKGNFTIKTYISKDNVLSADDIQDVLSQQPITKQAFQCCKYWALSPFLRHFRQGNII